MERREHIGFADAPSWLLLMAFAALLMGAKLWLISIYSNATPFWDQWNGEAANLYQPFFAGSLSIKDFLAAHNEHRILLTRLLALGLLDVNGRWNPLLQMLVNAALHVGALMLVLTLLTRITGKRSLWLLLAFTLLFNSIPYAWENTLEGFQSQFYFVMLFSVGCLWLTCMHEPMSLRWWCGVICAVLAYLSLASGIFAVAAAAVVGIVIYLLGLRRDLRQLAAVGVLLALFVVGYLLTPLDTQGATHSATSFKLLYRALIKVLSWPFPYSEPTVLLRNLPALWFMWRMWKDLPALSDSRWFLLALVIWTFGQSLSVAYGRADGPLASRYLDLFALGVLANFACLCWLVCHATDVSHRRLSQGLWVWVILIFMALGLYAQKHSIEDLAEKRVTGLAQEANVRAYLQTGDIAVLKNQPPLMIPYPDAERLAAILSVPSIRNILPQNLVNGPAGRLDAAVNVVLSKYYVFLLLGAALAGVCMLHGKTSGYLKINRAVE